MWTADAWRSNRISGHSFIGNKFTGKPSLPYNLATQNFTNHTFIGNDFSIPPKNLLGTNANTIYGAGNTVDGGPNNSAFGVKQ